MLKCNIEYTPMNPEEKFQAEDGTQLADGGKYMTHSGPVHQKLVFSPDTCINQLNITLELQKGFYGGECIQIIPLF